MAQMYSQKYQNIQLPHDKERLFSPLGYAKENISAGRTQLRQHEQIESEKLYLKAVPVKLLTLYWFDKQYCQDCQYINYFLLNAYLFMDSDITSMCSQTENEFQGIFKSCANVQFDQLLLHHQFLLPKKEEFKYSCHSNINNYF